jgi:predicted SAM-dependent methyltransferase
MRIPWKLKSLLFSIVDRYGLQNLLYWGQRWVSRRAPRSFENVSSNWRFHESNILSWKKIDIDNVFEFGAGRTLAQNLFLSRSIQKQTVVDLNPMLNLKLCESARKRLLELREIGPGKEIKGVSDLERFGISYIAPMNAAATDKEDGSFSALISTNTFEHIPRDEIPLILKEVFRILKDGALLSIIIDYSDHYSHTDEKISKLNFLRYDEVQWKRYNHPSNYQNRLRHHDYLMLFKSAGFSVISSEFEAAETDIPEEISVKFRGAADFWEATKGFFVLEK